LTCDFWAEKCKRKITARINVLESVASLWAFGGAVALPGELLRQRQRQRIRFGDDKLTTKKPKQKAKAKAIDQSLRPSGFCPAFGRPVAASRLA
jgi:hypothetical protein